MAEPTLKDVLKAIAAVGDDVAIARGEMAKMRAEMAKMRAEMATKVETNARFDRVDKEIGDLDRDLTGHMGVHREIEKDIETLKKRAPRTAARATRTPRGR